MVLVTEGEYLRNIWTVSIELETSVGPEMNIQTFRASNSTNESQKDLQLSRSSFSVVSTGEESGPAEMLKLLRQQHHLPPSAPGCPQLPSAAPAHTNTTQASDISTEVEVGYFTSVAWKCFVWNPNFGKPLIGFKSTQSQWSSRRPVYPVSAAR